MSLLFIFTLQFCLFTSVISTGSNNFRCDYKYHPEVEGWIKVHQLPATWHEARLRCQLEGSVLLSPINYKLLSVMKTEMSNVNKCGLFTGVHATFSKGDYFSVEGVPISKMPIQWAPDEPDNYKNNEDCLILLTNGTVADINCFETYPFMCYVKKSLMVNDSSLCDPLDPEYKYYGQTLKCYKFHPEGRNWTRAFMTCAAEGGHLAIIGSETEAAVIKEVCDNYPTKIIPPGVQNDVVMLGFHDWGENGIFMTIHGETLKQAGYEKWASGQPNDMAVCGGQSCGGAFRNGLFADLCCNKRYPFICEKDPLLHQRCDD